MTDRATPSAAARHEVGAYRDLDRLAVKEAIEHDGWDPILFADPPGAVYPPHRHAETKLLVFLVGSMDVTAGGRTYRCAPGDRLVIPSNLEHAAQVGPAGCTFFWSEQVR